MAAPSSAHTIPSHIAKIAPSTHPIIAWGPPIALTINGIVMNGPTPIMSIMFSAVALLSPTPRIRRGSLESGCDGGSIKRVAGSKVLVACTQKPASAAVNLKTEAEPQLLGPSYYPLPTAHWPRHCDHFCLRSTDSHTTGLRLALPPEAAEKTHTRYRCKRLCRNAPSRGRPSARVLQDRATRAAAENDHPTCP